MFANQDMTDEYFNQSLFYDFMMLMMPVFAASFFPGIPLPSNPPPPKDR